MIFCQNNSFPVTKSKTVIQIKTFLGFLSLKYVAIPDVEKTFFVLFCFFAIKTSAFTRYANNNTFIF